MSNPGEIAMSPLESVAVRLEQLRSLIEVGQAQTNGQLAVLVEQSKNTATTVAQQREWAEKEVKRLDDRIDGEEDARAEAVKEAAGVSSTAIQTLSGHVDELRRRNAVLTGVGLTVSGIVGAFGGVIMTHVWPH